MTFYVFRYYNHNITARKKNTNGGANSSSTSLSEAMDSIEPGPTEDVVQAFLDYLLDPVLPFKASVRDIPSRFQQELVAKQVHAVVLLYNYYHRKHHPSLEFLGFESFCKLAAILKPNLVAHFKLMRLSDYTELDDVENHISITEKAIMNACDISTALDASKDIPVIKGWPVHKVAVLLVDSMRNNCFLLFDSITTGVWSVIEKDVNNASHDSSGKQGSKRKRITRKPLRGEPAADEASLEELVFLAVKEAAGNNQSDLVVLESHVVYSLSKEKKAVRFYIVQCTQPNCEDLHIPLKDAMQSCQGAFMKKIPNGWTVTPTVKYFHLLPYAGILADWMSREVFSNSLQDKKVEVESMDVDNCHLKENPEDEEILETIAISIEYPKQKDTKEGQSIYFSNIENSPLHITETNGSYVPSHVNDYQSNNSTCSAVNFSDHPKVQAELEKTTMNPEKEEIIENKDTPAISAESAKQKDFVIDEKIVNITESYSETKALCIIDEQCRGEEQMVSIVEDNVCSNILPEEEEQTETVPSNTNFLEKVTRSLGSQENELTQTAVTVLRAKRDKLAHRIRILKDEIALCDRDIEIHRDGTENHFAQSTKIDNNGCCNISLKTKTESADKDDQRLLMDMKKSSEATFPLRNPCQEVDDICYASNWKLPIYTISLSNVIGEYLARITMKGDDFKLSTWSDSCCSPREARQSAASKMIARLQLHPS